MVIKYITNQKCLNISPYINIANWDITIYHSLVTSGNQLMKKMGHFPTNINLPSSINTENISICHNPPMISPLYHHVHPRSSCSIYSFPQNLRTSPGKEPPEILPVNLRAATFGACRKHPLITFNKSGDVGRCRDMGPV